MTCFCLVASFSGISDIHAAHDRYLRTKYFGSLDGLRCLSILMVIGFHCQLTATAFFRTGQYGVSLFFVISGFLITTLLLREQRRDGQISLKDFYIRRTLRIFPLYYAVLLLYVGLVFKVEHGPERGTFWHNLPFFFTYTSNWFVDKDAAGRVVFAFAWSLATEEQFYLCWPSIVRFASRLRWWVPLAIILALAGIDVTMELATGLGLIDFGGNGNRIATSIATPICLGCALAYLFDRRRGFAIAWRALGRKLSAPLALLMLLGSYLVYQHFAGVGTSESTVATTPAGAVAEAAMIIAMVLLVGACCIRADNGLRLLLGNPIVRYVGTISYGLYLLHMLAMNATRRLRDEHDWLFLVIAFAISLAMASASYWIYELPFLRLKNRFRHRGQPRAEDHAKPAEASAATAPAPTAPAPVGTMAPTPQLASLGSP